MPYYENEIEIDFHSDTGYINLTCRVPGYEERGKFPNLELFVEFDSLTDLIYEFMITSLDDLTSINQESMYKRFLVGRCTMYCYLEPDLEFYLGYRRNGHSLIATNPQDDTHEVPKDVKTPEEIIIYTGHYYDMKLV